MRVFLTGGGGFLGRHLTERLRAAGHEVTAPASAEVDLASPGAGGALAAYAPRAYDRIFHLAAWTRAGRFCDLRAGDQWVVNQRINTSVLAWWQAEQPQAKLIAFGTSASYATEGPLREADYLAGSPSPAYFAYAMSKRMLLAGLMSLERQYGLRWAYLVPSTLYGPSYHLDGRELHFVYDVCRKIVRARRHDEPVVLWGDGHQLRELVHVADCAAWVEALAERAEQEVVNLGAGSDHSIREIAATLCELAGYPSERLSYDTDAFTGVRAKVLATDRLDALLPQRPRTPLRQGLAEVVEWTEAHLEELTPQGATS